MIHANHTRPRGKTSWALAIALTTLGTQALYDAHEQHQCDFWRSQFKLP